MRIPKFLEASGTIGFVAPAFGCNMEPTKAVELGLAIHHQNVERRSIHFLQSRK